MLPLLAVTQHIAVVGDKESRVSDIESPIINNILSRLLPSINKGRKIEQISREEFYKLFGTARRQLRIQDVTGADTGVQYDFIPHVESEALPESATYTFFLRAEDPRIFLFDDLDLEENVRVSNIPEKKNKNSPRRPKVQLEFEESKQKTDSGSEAKEHNRTCRINRGR